MHLKREDIEGLRLTPESLDRQAAISDARLVLGVIDMLEHLDEREPSESLESQIARLESWLDQPEPLQPDAAQRRFLSGLLG